MEIDGQGQTKLGHRDKAGGNEQGRMSPDGTASPTWSSPPQVLVPPLLVPAQGPVCHVPLQPARGARHSLLLLLQYTPAAAHSHEPLLVPGKWASHSASPTTFSAIGPAPEHWSRCRPFAGTGRGTLGRGHSTGKQPGAEANRQQEGSVVEEASFLIRAFPSHSTSWLLLPRC